MMMMMIKGLRKYAIQIWKECQLSLEWPGSRQPAVLLGNFYNHLVTNLIIHPTQSLTKYYGKAAKTTTIKPPYKRRPEINTTTIKDTRYRWFGHNMRLTSTVDRSVSGSWQFIRNSTSYQVQLLSQNMQDRLLLHLQLPTRVLGY